MMRRSPLISALPLLLVLTLHVGTAQAQFDWLRERNRQHVSDELDRLRDAGKCGPAEGLLACKDRIKKESARKDGQAACQKKLREIKDSCAAAGSIFDCIAIRGEPYGIRYDDTFNFSGRPDIRYFSCP